MPFFKPKRWAEIYNHNNILYWQGSGKCGGSFVKSAPIITSPITTPLCNVILQLFGSRCGVHFPHVGTPVTELDKLNSREVMSYEVWLKPQNPCMIPCALLELCPATMWIEHAWATFLDDERHLTWTPPFNLNKSQPISKAALQVTKDPRQNPADKRTNQLHLA